MGAQLGQQATYRTSLGRTHVQKEDMNIEDIHCQIVMRVQRNKQLLREIEGGPEDEFVDFMANSNSQSKRSSKPVNTVEICKDLEVLGPDYCSRKPVFLNLKVPSTSSGKASRSK